MESVHEKSVSVNAAEGIENLSAYEVVSHEFLPDIDSDSWLLRHKKTGARIALLPKKDTNKVFYIAFRTPPEDSTGVAHIIEHTVLCGSRKFPIKDPFIELAKGSLNTFLNAMTYPDKTVYPVASCNDRDFSAFSCSSGDKSLMYFSSIASASLRSFPLSANQLILTPLMPMSPEATRSIFRI